MYCCVNLTILSRCGPRSLRSCELSQACAFSTLSHSEMPTRWGASPKTAVTLSLTTRAPPAFFVAVGYPGSKGERVSPCGIRGYARAMCTTSWPSGGCRVICPLPVVSSASTRLPDLAEVGGCHHRSSRIRPRRSTRAQANAEAGCANPFPPHPLGHRKHCTTRLGDYP